MAINTFHVGGEQAAQRNTLANDPGTLDGNKTVNDLLRDCKLLCILR